MSRLTRDKNELKKDVAWGSTVVAGFVLLAGLIATVQFLIQGPEFFYELGVTYGHVLLLYLVIALIGGPILGLLRPLLRTRLGGAFVGFVLALFFYGSAGLLVDQDASLAVNIGTSAIGALLIGAPAGFIIAGRLQKG